MPSFLSTEELNTFATRSIINLAPVYKVGITYRGPHFACLLLYNGYTTIFQQFVGTLQIPAAFVIVCFYMILYKLIVHNHCIH